MLHLLWQETKRKELTTWADVHSQTIFNSHVKKWFLNTFVLDSNVKNHLYYGLPTRSV